MNTAAAEAPLDIIDRERDRVDKLQYNASLFRSLMKEHGFNTMLSQSPIIPLFVRSEQLAYQMARILFDEDIVVPPVVFSAVPKDKVRLRLCATANHSEADYYLAVEKLAQAARQLNLLSKSP